MASSPLGLLFAALARRQFAEATDAELLERFAEARDEPAFAELVRRYGPLVWRVARTALGPGPDAEDAFQVTFLALARNVGAVRQPNALACWLHRTAFRAALRARRTARRTLPLPPGSRRPDEPLGRLTAQELLAALDEEIQALPERLRAPLLLCCLEGLSQEEAAGRLGWSPGSVKGRLERARALLRRRLAARGFTVPVALAGLVVVGGVASAVPPGLGETTLAALRSGQLSPTVAKLITEVIAMNQSFTLKAALAITMLAGGLTLIAGLGQMESRPPLAPRVAVAEPDVPPKPAAKPAGEGRMLVFRDTKFLWITPDGKEAGELPGHPDNRILNEPVLSPDGKRVAFTVNEHPPTDADGNLRRHVFIRTLDGADPGER